jgi:hypothetical protein
MVVQGVAKEGFKAAGVWYQVEQFRNVGPDSMCAFLWVGPHRTQVQMQTNMRLLLRAIPHQHP